MANREIETCGIDEHSPRRGNPKRLRIDMTPMSEDQRQAVFQAEHLLKGAGVAFDTAYSPACNGSVFRDWELDWSLQGATLG